MSSEYLPKQCSMLSDNSFHKLSTLSEKQKNHPIKFVIPSDEIFEIILTDTMKA